MHLFVDSYFRLYYYICKICDVTLSQAVLEKEIVVDAGSRIIQSLYRQIADYFAAQIRDEVLKPGRKLPSESELCSQFSVSRVTARKAIRELEALGLVYSRQGKGTYVQQRPLEEKPRNNPSFTSVVKEHGMSDLQTASSVDHAGNGTRKAAVSAAAGQQNRIHQAPAICRRQSVSD